MSDPKSETPKVFEHPTWLYTATGDARLFEEGEEVPKSGWKDHPPKPADEA